MSSNAAIIAVGDAEIADFLPGTLWAELEKSLPAYRRIMPPVTPADWQRIWRENPAAILVSAWQTPALPAELPVGENGSLRYVCHLAGTVRKLIPRDLIARGLVVTNWGDSISATVAECTLMLTLMALRRASYWAVAMHREGAWKDSKTFTQSILGRRVGLHGLGAIGQCLVPMLRPFTDRIQAYSPRIPDTTFTRLDVARAHSLEALFSTSDIVVELAAATPENQAHRNRGSVTLHSGGGRIRQCRPRLCRGRGSPGARGARRALAGGARRL